MFCERLLIQFLKDCITIYFIAWCYNFPRAISGKSAGIISKKQITDSKVESTKVPQEDETTSNNADVLLEQAIQSLGVPSDMILGTGLIPEEPLTFLGNENFSTVNLRDLD